MIHQLRTESNYFEDIVSGRKAFEVRLNDRDFRVGDFLGLNELAAPAAGAEGTPVETGRCCLIEVVYVLTDSRFVQEGYAILAIRPCAIWTRARDMMYGKNGGDEIFRVPVYGEETALVGEDTK